MCERQKKAPEHVNPERVAQLKEQQSPKTYWLWNYVPSWFWRKST